jgi:hypothetical protein
MLMRASYPAPLRSSAHGALLQETTQAAHRLRTGGRILTIRGDSATKHQAQLCCRWEDYRTVDGVSVLGVNPAVLTPFAANGAMAGWSSCRPRRDHALAGLVRLDGMHSLGGMAWTASGC